MTGLGFIHLFSGLGGFHQALRRLGHTCIFASETDPGLADLDEKSFDMREAFGEVPPHDILCAGFRCQPFSKANDGLGFDRPQWGNVFDCVLEILDTHKPTNLLIKDTPNLLRHDIGRSFGQ
ncbi:DNA cytosine methyltransferase [Verrucomicrobium sp. 3C]|uniref:DNA cytosine methyltransferase n=1 Tax=Verrucomicrobium sp. 3C TaxID=1134055 RepID=UPI00039E4503|nr:DNA cytosine methyltransferase [Verrucomicrobium sp. 3C]